MGTIVEPKYPGIEIDLTGENGNVFNLLHIISKSATRQGLSDEEYQIFRSEATSNDYDHFLRTCMKWFTIN